jgi:type I restriction enzyme, S subunit
MSMFQRLDGVCEILMGQAPNGNAYNFEGEGWPLIAGSGDFGELHPNVKKFTTEATRLSNPGDIVLGIRATIGEKVTADGEYCLGRGVAGLRAKPSLNSRYLWHWLTQVRPILASKAKGATFKQVNKEDIGELKIPLLHLPEQRHIAAILDQADTLRAKRREALAQLENLPEAIFIEMFGDPSKDSKGIKVEPLDEHLLFLTSGGRGWAKYYANTGSRFIRSLDVQMNRIGQEDMAFVNAPANAEARRTEIKADDILLTITGSLIGRVATVPDNLAGAYISQHVAILRINCERIDPNFLSRFLSFDLGGQRQIAKAQYGQTKPGLNFEQIRGFQIPMPPIELQHEFTNRVGIVENLKSNYQASLSELDALFASLQHRAFRGEL